MIETARFFSLGLLILVLQSTWFYGEVIHPFRFDLVFILIVFLGTLERLGPVLVVGFLLGLIYDVLSWGGIGKAMFLYPLLVWVMHRIWFRTVVQSHLFLVAAVFFFDLLYGLFVYFFQALSWGQAFSRDQAFLILIQAVITTLLAVPLSYLFRTFFGRKTALA